MGKLATEAIKIAMLSVCTAKERYDLNSDMGSTFDFSNINGRNQEEITLSTFHNTHAVWNQTSL